MQSQRRAAHVTIHPETSTVTASLTKQSPTSVKPQSFDARSVDGRPSGGSLKCDIRVLRCRGSVPSAHTRRLWEGAVVALRGVLAGA